MASKLTFTFTLKRSHLVLANYPENNKGVQGLPQLSVLAFIAAIKGTSTYTAALRSRAFVWRRIYKKDQTLHLRAHIYDGDYGYDGDGDYDGDAGDDGDDSDDGGGGDDSDDGNDRGFQMLLKTTNLNTLSSPS